MIDPDPPTPPYCRRHRRTKTARYETPALSPSGSQALMFLPPELTPSEQELVGTITRQLLEHRAPSTTDDEQAVRYEAAQIAAEMIYETRGAETTSDPQAPEAVDRADNGYHQRMRETLERQRQLQELEAAEMDEPPGDQ
jgi:hypothetical protein